jgi:hypothetical protein
MVGDLVPPPPRLYESPSERRKAARESIRRTRRERKVLEEEVRLQHGGLEAVGTPIKPHEPEISKSSHQIPASSAIYDPGRGLVVLQIEQIEPIEIAMAGEGSKEGIASGAAPRRPLVQRSEERQQQMNPGSQ